MQVLIALAVRPQPLHYTVLKVGLELVGVVGEVNEETEDAVDET